jgi:hypothetical protein
LEWSVTVDTASAVEPEDAVVVRLLRKTKTELSVYLDIATVLCFQLFPGDIKASCERRDVLLGKEDITGIKATAH